MRTILTPLYRLTALDLTDPRISEGYRLTLSAIRQMKQRADEAGVGFAVLLIPTKELVFEHQVRLASTRIPPAYERLIENEKEVIHITRAFMDENGIDYIDALPALRAKVADGVQPYDYTVDGHPNAVGQHAIATSVHTALCPTASLCPSKW